jgi:hypothetical protein
MGSQNKDMILLSERNNKKINLLTIQEHHDMETAPKFVLILGMTEKTSTFKMKMMPDYQMRHEISADQELQMRSMKTNIYFKREFQKNNKDLYNTSKIRIIAKKSTKTLTIRSKVNNRSRFTRFSQIRTYNMASLQQTTQISQYKTFNSTHTHIRMKNKVFK